MIFSDNIWNYDINVKSSVFLTTEKEISKDLLNDTKLILNEILYDLYQIKAEKI